MGLPERILENPLVNPLDISAKALLGAGAIYGLYSSYKAGDYITLNLHDGIHGMRYSERVQRYLDIRTAQFTGMAPDHWVDHIAHHKFPDKYDQVAHTTWDENRPEGAPKSPAKAWTDPYSWKKLQDDGKSFPHLRVLLGTPELHSKSYRDVVTFLRELVAYDDENNINDRNHWPDHFKHIDVTTLDPELFFNKWPYHGFLLNHALFGLITGPISAGTSLLTHYIGIRLAGGDINEVHHTGDIQLKSERLARIKRPLARAAVILGLRKAVPFKNGEYAADTTNALGFIRNGNQKHKKHHEDPSNPMAAGDNYLVCRAAFWIRVMLLTGDAALPPGINYTPKPILGKFDLHQLHNKEGVPPVLDYSTQRDVMYRRITRKEAIQKMQEAA